VPQISTSHTRHFDVHFSRFFFNDFDRNGRPSKGDQIVFNDQLFTGRRHVGQDAGSCTVANSRKLIASCSGAIELRDGQITFGWLNSPPPVKHFAVTGGTGRYANVRGAGTVVESATGPVGTMTLHLLP
jgi:hypothetical protein